MKITACLILALLSSNGVAQTIEGTSNAVALDFRREGDEAVTLASLGVTKVPKYYALIMGVSEYQNAGRGLPNLDMPVQDAERLASLLQEKYMFEPEYVQLLKNPTREEVINQLDKLSETVTDKDNLLIFYAGHGVYDETKGFGYWLPTDAKLTSRASWIANSTIKDYLGAIKAKHTLLITDACFGGSIFKTRSVETQLKRFFELYKLNSRKALTSGNLSEVPDKSVFLRYLIQALDQNEIAFLSSANLFTRIYEPILNNAATTPQFGVVQGAGDEGGDFIFIKR
jgi:hypothetical protein